MPTCISPRPRISKKSRVGLGRISIAGLVRASLSSRSPMACSVMYLPSLPASGESFTDARTDRTGGSIGLHSTGGTFACETSVCVHLGTKPVTLTATMSPAMAFSIGSRDTPCTTVMSFTLPLPTSSPDRDLAIILSPFEMWPLKTLPVTVGPRPGSWSICDTSMEKPPHFSSAASTAWSGTMGVGGGTVSRMVSKRAIMSVGRLSDRASSKERAQNPALPDA
mmetsp:Transcript_17539/g.45159  ORF Transcript_17539/g.45159 Transcript_17539/m.45159 type:complete len:223 (-) Transcript_17539:739-1407(-)